MGNIFNIFGPSPIKPLEQHMRKVHQCAKQLPLFIEAALAEDWVLAKSINDKIVQFEKEADAIKRDLRLNVPSGLFLPVSRTSLLELLSVQDRIANKTEQIAGVIFSRQMKFPSSLIAPLMHLLERSLDASKQACQAINELDELLESGFRGNEVKIVDAMIVNLHDIEHETDDKLSDIRHKIFELESEMPAIEVFFLYKIVQWIADLADHAQTVGERLQILIAR